MLASPAATKLRMRSLQVRRCRALAPVLAVELPCFFLHRPGAAVAWQGQTSACTFSIAWSTLLILALCCPVYVALADGERGKSGK